MGAVIGSLESERLWAWVAALLVVCTFIVVLALVLLAIVKKK